MKMVACEDAALKVPGRADWPVTDHEKVYVWAKRAGQIFGSSSSEKNKRAPDGVTRSARGSNGAGVPMLLAVARIAFLPQVETVTLTTELDAEFPTESVTVDCSL